MSAGEGDRRLTRLTVRRPFDTLRTGFCRNARKVTKRHTEGSPDRGVAIFITFGTPEWGVINLINFAPKLTKLTPLPRVAIAALI